MAIINLEETINLNRSKQGSPRSISNPKTLTSKHLDSAQQVHLFERLFPEMLELKNKAIERMALSSLPLAANG